MWNKSELSEMLRNRRLEVSFIKKDGSLRVMNCTLLEKYLPTNDKETTKKENDSVLSVWDIDNNGWRSFRLDSITEVRIVIND
jgi:hypothetical protein